MPGCWVSVPPSTRYSAPATKLASSEARKATTAATSSGWPTRWTGATLAAACGRSGNRRPRHTHRAWHRRRGLVDRPHRRPPRGHSARRRLRPRTRSSRRSCRSCAPARGAPGRCDPGLRRRPQKRAPAPGCRCHQGRLRLSVSGRRQCRAHRVPSVLATNSDVERASRRSTSAAGSFSPIAVRRVISGRAAGPPSRTSNAKRPERHLARARGKSVVMPP